MLRAVIISIVFLVVCLSDSYAYTGKRQGLPDVTKTDRALYVIGTSRDASGLLKDYRRYLLAVKLYHVKENRNSILVLDDFLREYPDSYLYRDALWLKILNYIDLYDREELDSVELGLFEKTLDGYLSRYPDDEEALFLKSRITNPSSEEHMEALKALYLLGGDYFDYLDGMGIFESLSHDEAKDLARVLIRKVRYEAALTILKRALKRWDTGDLHTLLADTLFRMKDYPSAAREYEEAGDLYRAALSYKRAAMMDEFERLYSRVTRDKTKEACELIITKARELRWNGEHEDALRILRRAFRSGYPCRERLLWSITWTEYRMRNFLSASYNLKKLFREYGKERYLYWLIRSLEQMGKNPYDLYTRMGNHSFYSYLLKDKVPYVRISYNRMDTPMYYSEGPPGSREISASIKRAELLYRLGLQGFAVDELRSSYVRFRQERMSICKSLLRIGEFYEAVKCVAGINTRDSLYIRYPLAYRDLVDRIARENGLDPLLLLSIMREESRFNEKALSVSGALGLMQLMPFTARWIASISGLQEDLKTEEILLPENNILMAARYLRRLLDEFHSVAPAVAAYNAGEGSVRRWLESQKYESLDEFIEDIPYTQTYYYVQKVLSSYMNYIRIYRRGQW